MNMEGKRFGAGILGGLLLGLLIVGSSGISAGVFGSFSAVAPAQVDKTATTVAISSTVLLTTTTAGSAYNNGPGTTTQSVSSATTQQSTTEQPLTSSPDFAAWVASGADQRSPSHLGSIVAQPALVDAVILLPLLVAVILGAILFRASGRSQVAAEPGPEVKDE